MTSSAYHTCNSAQYLSLKGRKRVIGKERDETAAGVMQGAGSFKIRAVLLNSTEQVFAPGVNAF